MSEISDIQRRIIEFLDTTGDSDREISRKTGLNAGYMGSARKGTEMGASKIDRILNAYPQLNRRWILDGVGPMTSDETKWSRAEFYELMKIIRESLKDNDSLDELVERAISMVNHLEDENAEMRAELMSLLRGE